MLNFIAAKPGCGVAELADFLDMDISTATRNLRLLVQAGFVAMRAPASDARRREIRLTAKGTRALDKSRELWAKVHKDTIADLGKDSAEQLLTLLRGMRS